MENWKFLIEKQSFIRFLGKKRILFQVKEKRIQNISMLFSENSRTLGQNITRLYFHDFMKTEIINALMHLLFLIKHILFFLLSTLWIILILYSGRGEINRNKNHYISNNNVLLRTLGTVKVCLKASYHIKKVCQ